jgi:hypothetical protein
VLTEDCTVHTTPGAPAVQRHMAGGDGGGLGYEWRTVVPPAGGVQLVVRRWSGPGLGDDDGHRDAEQSLQTRREKNS